MSPPPKDHVEQRARLSKGASGDSIYRMVAEEITSRGASGIACDIGCGSGSLLSYLPDSASEYVGVDLVRYDEFPVSAKFIQTPLDAVPWPIPDGFADMTLCVETIEHLENPRALLRELVRITRPAGCVIVTTPNQLSWSSLLTLLLRDQFNAFQERPGLYPAHITALLPVDLVRIAVESGLTDMRIRYSNRGRVPGTAKHWPSRLRGKRFSDTVLLSAVTPARTPIPP